MSEAEFLSKDEIATLSAVLDTLIPPSAAHGMPGAGELGLAAGVATEVAPSPELQALVRSGLERVEAGAGDATRFGDLDLQARQRLLQADTEPIFVQMLIAPTYFQYYEHPAVIEALGLEARPPHPLGYALEAGDLTLLDPVRGRAKFYRDC